MQSPGEQGEFSSNQPPFAPANNLPAGQATSHTRSMTATRGASKSPSEQGELSSNSPPVATANSIPAGLAKGKQPRVYTLRSSEDGLPRRPVAVWSARRGCVKSPPMMINCLCDSGSTAAVASKQKFEELGGELKVYTHDTIKLASSSGEELQVKGAFDIWVKLQEGDRYKRKIEALVVDGIDEDLILGVEQLKLLGLLPSSWPMGEEEQGGGDPQPKVYALQREISEEEELQEKIDKMEDTEEDFPEGEVQEVSEGAWEIEQDEHTVEDIPGIDSMPKRVQEVLRKHEEVFSNKLRKELNWPEQDICLLYTSPSPRDGLLSRMPSSA